MQAISALVVLVAAFGAAIGLPSAGVTNATSRGPGSAEQQSHFQVFRSDPTTSAPEIYTQTEGFDASDYGFNVPQVIQLFLNDTPEVESETEDLEPSIFGFNTPQVIQLFMNDTYNSTADAEGARSGEPTAIDRVDRSLDSNDDYNEDDEDEEDETGFIIEVNQFGGLVYKPTPATEGSLHNSSSEARR